MTEETYRVPDLPEGYFWRPKEITGISRIHGDFAVHIRRKLRVGSETVAFCQVDLSAFDSGADAVRYACEEALVAFRKSQARRLVRAEAFALFEGAAK